MTMMMMVVVMVMMIMILSECSVERKIYYRKFISRRIPMKSRNRPSGNFRLAKRRSVAK
jgi:hypothetical protein